MGAEVRTNRNAINCVYRIRSMPSVLAMMVELRVSTTSFFPASEIIFSSEVLVFETKPLL